MTRPAIGLPPSRKPPAPEPGEETIGLDTAIAGAATEAFDLGPVPDGAWLEEISFVATGLATQSLSVRVVARAQNGLGVTVLGSDLILLPARRPTALVRVPLNAQTRFRLRRALASGRRWLTIITVNVPAQAGFLSVALSYRGVSSQPPERERERQPRRNRGE